MDDIVICEPVRTPVGAFGGVFAGLSALDLATSALRSLLDRSGLGDGDVDDVVLGQCSPSGEAPAIGRVAALDAGLGTSVPGLQVDRRCGSGLQAVLQAAMQVATGASSLVIAGGVESMSQAEHYALGLRTGVRGDGVELMDRLARARVTAGGRSHPVPGGMLETAENLRRQYGISRDEQDRLALGSQQATAAAVAASRFADEIVGVDVPGRRGAAPELVDRRRAPATRHHARGPGPAAARPSVDRPRGDGHRRELQWTERRRGHVRRHDP